MCSAVIFVFLCFVCWSTSGRTGVTGSVSPLQRRPTSSGPRTQASDAINSTSTGNASDVPKDTMPNTTELALKDTRKVLFTESYGMETAYFSVDHALSYALLQANSSLAQLNRLFSPPEEFATYMDALVKNATSELYDHVQLASDTGLNLNGTAPTVSTDVLKICEKDLKARLFARLTPIFKRQVFLLKQEVTTTFNRRVTEEIPVTIYILEDLNDAAEETIRNFTTLVKKVTPKDAPVSTWNADPDLRELRQLLQEFIENLEHAYRAQGVLPRYGGSSGHSQRALRLGPVVLEPPPTELSVHVLASHPLGRDHRQDPLSMHRADKLAFSPGSKLPSPTPAADLRAALKRRVATMERESRSGPLLSRVAGWLHRAGVPVPSALHREARRSEAAREMMMLPLSLRNPDLSSASGVAAGVGAGGAGGSSGVRAMLARRRAAARAKADEGDWEGDLQERLRRGPERFVNWDVPPLPEAKGALDQLPATLRQKTAGSGESRIASFVDQALNVIPQLGRSYYPSPVVDYGPAYAASKPQDPA